MNAYDVRGNLMNRYVYGDYNDLMLSPGSNEIIVDGEIDALKIRDYSRWI